MNDQAIEQQIQAKGKTAPRVTPADIEANIASEHYFTASDGAVGVMAIRDAIGKKPGDEVTVAIALDVPDSLELLTFCVLVLRNGFTVTGESACASPENFDAEIGRNIARQNAVQKIWPLMGYQLREELHRAANQPPAPGAAHAGYRTMQPHQQRVVDEKAELDEKRAKLIAFFGAPIFAALPVDEKERLEAQEHFMGGYSNVLSDRIAHF